MLGFKIGIIWELVDGVFVKTVEIERIILDGFLGTTAFNFDGFEKIGDKFCDVKHKDIITEIFCDVKKLLWYNEENGRKINGDKF